MKTREYIQTIIAVITFMVAYLFHDAGKESLALWILIGFICCYISFMMILFVIHDHETSHKRSGKVNGGIEL